MYKNIADMTTEAKDQIVALVIELDKMDSETELEDQAKVVFEIQKLIRVEEEAAEATDETADVEEAEVDETEALEEAAETEDTELDEAA